MFDLSLKPMLVCIMVAIPFGVLGAFVLMTFDSTVEKLKQRKKEKDQAQADN